ncbi:hypothetical protein Taro_014982 [Colocasia esculenta]|uniref:Retrotransposon gag domain-containing protein n=1 Tax=Colocasia esculenta TaxID=4460 RepID=A0A843UJN4_COLES|nr:hypothetical protein [Colocasia esculenta]
MNSNSDFDSDEGISYDDLVDFCEKVENHKEIRIEIDVLNEDHKTQTGMDSKTNLICKLRSLVAIPVHLESRQWLCKARKIKDHSWRQYQLTLTRNRRQYRWMHTLNRRPEMWTSISQTSYASRSGNASGNFAIVLETVSNGSMTYPLRIIWLHVVDVVVSLLVTVSRGEMSLDVRSRLSSRPQHLRERADVWWSSLLRTRFEDGAVEVTWDEFVRLFRAKFVPEHIQDKMEQEFLSLTQGSMTILEYEARFSELSKYAPHIVHDERRKAKKFVMSLRPSLRTRLVAFDHRTLDEALSAACRQEGEMEQYLEEKKASQKRPIVPFQRQDKKKAAYQP